jgi:DNA-binding GntR family transcriptional regulator
METGMVPKSAEPSYELRGDPGMTLGEMVRKTLIALIVRGEFPEGYRLYPEQLSERLGVSITPVREALMQLATEGFIENIQRRGFHIRLPSAGQIRDLSQVRQSLELTAGELVIARLKSGELDPAELLVLDELQHIQERDPAHIDHAAKLELNSNLHSTIVALSGNALLQSLYEGLRHRVLGALVQRGSDSWRNRVAGESREHWAIINALKDTDIDAYDAAVRAHISRSLDDALADMDLRRAQS